MPPSMLCTTLWHDCVRPGNIRIGKVWWASTGEIRIGKPRAPTVKWPESCESCNFAQDYRLRRWGGGGAVEVRPCSPPHPLHMLSLHISHPSMSPAGSMACSGRSCVRRWCIFVRSGMVAEPREMTVPLGEMAFPFYTGDMISRSPRQAQDDFPPVCLLKPLESVLASSYLCPADYLSK